MRVVRYHGIAMAAHALPSQPCCVLAFRSEALLEQVAMNSHPSVFSGASIFTGLDWSGLDWSGLDSPKIVGQKLNILFHSLKLLAQPAFMSFLELVEVKGHVHIS